MQHVAALVLVGVLSLAHTTSGASSHDMWHRSTRSISEIPSAAAALDRTGHGSARLLLTLDAGSTAPARPAFDQAFAATFNNESSTDPTATLLQFSTLLSLVASLWGGVGKPCLKYVPELHSPNVQAVLAHAVELYSTTAKDGAKQLQLLQDISKRLDQLDANFGHPATRRVVLGCILQVRVRHEAGFPPALQAAVHKILLQLFQLHKRAAAAKGIVQFLHISKSGGTNLCMAAEQNSCTTQGFSEKHNCLVKEFNDIPRWVTTHAHK